METTINERIAALIKELRLNNSSFAHSISVTPTAISTIVNGRNKPGYDILESILKKYPEVNSDWLIKGEGLINRQEVSNKSIDGGAYGQQVLMQILEEMRSLKSQLETKDKQMEGMQRTIDALVGKSNDVTADDRHEDPKIIVHPAFARKSEKEVNDYQIA